MSRLKKQIEGKIEHSTTSGDKRGTALSGHRTIHARCVGYDRDRRIVVIINPFGKQSCVGTNSNLSSVTRQIIQDYELLNLLEVPWTPQSGNDSEVDPGEALEGTDMAGIKELDDEITQEDMIGYLIYLRMNKELSGKEFKTACRMIDDAMNLLDEEREVPPLKQCIVEIQYTQSTWPQKAKCIRVITYDPTEQGNNIEQSIPGGSSTIHTDAEEERPHDMVNLDRVTEDVDRLLEKLGSNSNAVYTSDRSILDEMNRRDATSSTTPTALSKPFPMVRPGVSSPSGGGQGGNITGGEIGKALGEALVTAHTNPYDPNDDGPLFKIPPSSSYIMPYNVSTPGNSKNWRVRNDPQEPMLTILKPYSLLSKRDTSIHTTDTLEKKTEQIVLMNPIRRADYHSILAQFGSSTLPAVGTILDNPGIIIRVVANAPIIASASGLVTKLESESDGVVNITIQHNQDISTEYRGLLRESVTVALNQSVNGGKIIGWAASVKGLSFITFTVTYKGGYKDPLKYIPGWK
jgi:murein DD-endopeptidase MepM/ murein hydrolase activator NlpD